MPVTTAWWSATPMEPATAFPPVLRLPFLIIYSGVRTPTAGHGTLQLLRTGSTWRTVRRLCLVQVIRYCLIYNSYNDYPLASMSIVLAGDTKFGGSARWDMGNGAQISGPHNLTLDWSAGSGYGEWTSVTVGSDVVGITLTNGNFGSKNMD